MKKRAIIIEILIWIFALVVLIGGAVLVYYQTQIKPNLYTIQFKDIDGITKGSPVRFLGINVGYVRKLTSADKAIMVQILITKKDMVIPKGTRARVEFYGLGGSKSIELMPSNSSDSKNIATVDNIRIGDVVGQARSFVQILEIIDKFVQNLDKNAIQNILEVVEDISPNEIKKVEADMKTTTDNITFKVKDVQTKQTAMSNTINKANEMVLKLNKFVKK